MSDLDRDPIVRRAIDELRTLPANDPAAIRRVVEAAAAARLMPADDQPAEPRARRGRAWRFAAVASAAAIAGVVVSRTLWRTPEPVQTMAAAAAAAAETSASAHPFAIQPAANAGTELLPIPRQFVLDRGDAKRVALVGDFNEWNPSAAAMTRVGNLWSVTLPIVPGRHMYGFMVDDSLFVLDPRAPKASDSDLGVEGSVIIVGQP